MLSAALIAVLVATGLSACQTKIGLAAAVNDVRLSDSDLSSYIKPGTAPYQDSSTGTTVVPKLYVLEVWVRTELVLRAIAAHGGPLTSDERTAARAYLLGGRDISTAEAQFTKQGYENKLGDLVVDQSVALIVIIQRLQKGTSLAQAYSLLQQSTTSSVILSTIAKTKPKVLVSQRYGAWDATTLSLSKASTAGLPSFVQVSSTAAAAG